jgi:NhaP-type Na+/H+ or K+/H+ antiporter
MQWRYLKVFKRKILALIFVVALIVVSSVTKGKTSVVLSTITGIILIIIGIYYIIWIMKTPVKKEKDEGI